MWSDKFPQPDFFISEQIVWRSTCYIGGCIRDGRNSFLAAPDNDTEKSLSCKVESTKIEHEMSWWIFLVRCSYSPARSGNEKCGKMLLSWWKLVKNDPDVLSGCCSMEHETTNFAIKLMASKHLVDVFRRQKCVKNNGKYFTTRDDFVYSVWTRTFGSRLMDSSMCCVSLGVTAAFWE